jgi:hypothetical protein
LVAHVSRRADFDSISEFSQPILTGDLYIPRQTMTFVRPTWVGGFLLTGFLASTPLQAELPLSAEHKDNIRQVFCLNQHWLPHTQRTWNRHCIPSGQNYTEAAVPTAMVTVATLPAVPVSTAQVNNAGVSSTWISKIYHLSASAVRIDHIQLDQIGLAMDQGGQLSFSGRLYNQGGKNGELLGNNVKVVLRAFGGQSNEGTPLTLPRAAGPVGGPMLWEKEIPMGPSPWLAARQAKTISLSLASDVNLVRHFSKITGFDVTLAYDKGR